MLYLFYWGKGEKYYPDFRKKCRNVYIFTKIMCYNKDCEKSNTNNTFFSTTLNIFN